MAVMDRYNDFVNLLIFLLRLIFTAFMRASRHIIGGNICHFVGSREGKSCNKLALSRKCFVPAAVPLRKAVEPRIEHFRAALSLERD